ncbi:magnesium transporter CorA family protein [candidate division KSB1 bacterium]|nr:magnesium transporter CorA family protein [candidate division KSB1 bacterium]
MIQSYEIQNRMIVPVTAERASILVFTCADETEKRRAHELLDLDLHDIESALDPDEVSRIEFDDDRVFIIWKQPLSVTFDQRLRFDVASVGLLLEPHRLTIITAAEEIYFTPREFKNVESPLDVLLRYLLSTIRHYLDHLKGIKQITSELQTKVNTSLENKYLLQMFGLSESLTYYMNAIEGNELVLAKLSVNPRKARLSEPQGDLLDDIRLDNHQCARQAQIYSEVLSGLMDARGNIVNNNMTILLRDLTLINIIFLPLNLIAGIGGMSEFSMMTSGTSWKLSYALFIMGMVAMGWLTWMVLVRFLRKR